MFTQTSPKQSNRLAYAAYEFLVDHCDNYRREYNDYCSGCIFDDEDSCIANTPTDWSTPATPEPTY